MAGREWRPGKKGKEDKVFAQMLEESIDGQRSLTNYEGSDEDWQKYVANKSWDVDKYQNIGFNSGYISATLNLIEETGAMVSEALIEKAKLYMY